MDERRRSTIPLDLASSYMHTPQVTLELELDCFRLEALEAVRNGGDLALVLTLHAVMADASGASRYQQAVLNYSVNQGVWVRLLEAMGYQKSYCWKCPSLAPRLPLSWRGP